MCVPYHQFQIICHIILKGFFSFTYVNYVILKSSYNFIILIVKNQDTFNFFLIAELNLPIFGKIIKGDRNMEATARKTKAH